MHLATSPDGFRIVYFQGHPEYDRNSLLKEYKREVGRFLAGDLDVPPPYPEHYMTPEADDLAQAYLRDALAARAHGARRPVLPEKVMRRPTSTTPGATRAARSSTTGWAWSTSSPGSTATSPSWPVSTRPTRWASSGRLAAQARRTAAPTNRAARNAHSGPDHPLHEQEQT